MATAFSAEQIAALSAPLDRAKVRQREQGRATVSYIEGWQAIAEANRIFGFDGWQRQTLQLCCIHQGERSIGRDHRPGWGVTYTARVRITITPPSGEPALIREGCGAGHGIDTDLGQAHESALKEAETDAMKRALMTFGNPFGLALYDKQQREVTSSAAAAIGDQARRAPAPARHQSVVRSIQGRRPQSGPVQPSDSIDPALVPLDPAAIQQLHDTIRSLPRPLLEGLSKAFRKRFQIPPEASTIADRITQRRHHDWIEAFLVRHQGQPKHERVAACG
ncbi:RAD52 family DNA repair protein [Cyanobium sp. ATX 6A2]|uniref:RAD52 family DNA repair protein n=1 Tax=Cyanobium sp. ATX 6A2 TaxID=2823700 RepID=UPI0020CF8274|nr:RAD52 family DNA repair protein [Cyanobium sp. ATX 6A2]MCP9889268.1 RAD52 family DNA repair protein [Cyanobium sp. ATX 6A2]